MEPKWRLFQHGVDGPREKRWVKDCILKIARDELVYIATEDLERKRKKAKSNGRDYRALISFYRVQLEKRRSPAEKYDMRFELFYFDKMENLYMEMERVYQEIYAAFDAALNQRLIQESPPLFEDFEM